MGGLGGGVFYGTAADSAGSVATAPHFLALSLGHASYCLTQTAEGLRERSKRSRWASAAAEEEEGQKARTSATRDTRKHAYLRETAGPAMKRLSFSACESSSLIVPPLINS